MSRSIHIRPELQGIINDYTSIYGINLSISTSTPTSERNQQLWSREYYQRYLQTSPEEINEGQYVAIIYPEQKVHLFDTYELAVRGTRILARNHGLFITQHPIQAVQEVAYLSVETVSISDYKIPYTKAQIMDPNQEESVPLEVELRIDIGATVCLLPQSLCTSLQLKSTGLPRPINVAGVPRVLETTDVEISIDGLPYVAPKIGYILGSETGLVGQSFLSLCQHTWTGLQRVSFKLLTTHLELQSPGAPTPRDSPRSGEVPALRSSTLEPQPLLVPNLTPAMDAAQRLLLPNLTPAMGSAQPPRGPSAVRAEGLETGHLIIRDQSLMSVRTRSLPTMKQLKSTKPKKNSKPFK